MHKLACSLLFLLFAQSLQAAQYMSAQQFLQAAFEQKTYNTQTLWLDEDLKRKAADIMRRNWHSFRVRYWTAADKTAWILDEIGKERPITIGVVVQNQKIISLKILEFRESRGYEVRHSFFTQQFQGLALQPDKADLNGHVDGITGATLSVRAVKKVATLALFFHTLTPTANAQAQRSP